MIPPPSFFIFTDLTSAAIILWASDSIEECLGYTPEEVVGMTAYTLLSKDDIPESRTTHHEYILNDFVASQATLGYRRKDGSTAVVNIVFNTCHDFIVGCVTLLNANDSPSIREDSAQWHGLQGEYMGYQRSIAGATAIEGKPFLLFIRADDLASFVENMDVAKSTSLISHMRFWFQSPHWPQEIPCEAAVVGTADGLVLIMRLCRPFVRRRLIGSMGLYDARKHPQRGESYSAGSLNSQTGWSSCSATASPSPPSPPSLNRRLAGSGLVDSPSKLGKFRRIVELYEDEEELGDDEESEDEKLA
ncbi:hypothetical protein EC968_010237 [Mortierella alpina]|nr:hypothetical protein EC968_010237 [Mortierella alpina]